MSEQQQKNLEDVRMNKKAVTIRIIVIVSMILLCGILTRVIPQGTYQRQVVNGHTVIVENSFEFLDNKPLAIWHWVTAPFEALASSSGLSGIIIILTLLFMGGVMVVLDKSKIMVYIISVVQKKFGNDRYKLMYVMCAVMMAMGSTLSFYDQCGIFIPISLGIAFSYGWDSLTGVGLSFMPIAMGFAASTINPFVVGIPQTVAGLPINSGIWLRAILLVIMYFMYVIFLKKYILKIEADPTKSLTYETDQNIRGMFPSKIDEDVLQDKKVRKGTIIFLISVIFIILYTVASLFVSALSSLTMPVMLVALVIGTCAGAAVSGRAKGQIVKGLFGGMKVTAPAAIIIFLIMGLKQIITAGNIMDTLLYYAYNSIEGTNPYAAVFIILIITMVMEFIIGSASTKAYLLLPLLVPLGNMVGLTTQTIVQAYIFGDGFTNAFYPTSNMVLLITGIIGTSYGKWLKWSRKLIAGIAVLVILTLIFCVAIGYGPF